MPTAGPKAYARIQVKSSAVDITEPLLEHTVGAVETAFRYAAVTPMHDIAAGWVHGIAAAGTDVRVS